jgi:hypothetical protein
MQVILAGISSLPNNHSGRKVAWLAQLKAHLTLQTRRGLRSLRALLYI